MTRKKLISREVALIVSMIGIVLLMVLQFIWLRNAYRISEQNLKDKCMECLEEALSDMCFNSSKTIPSSNFEYMTSLIINEKLLTVSIFDIYTYCFGPYNIELIDSAFSEQLKKKHGLSLKYDLYLSNRDSITPVSYIIKKNDKLSEEILTEKDLMSIFDTASTYHKYSTNKKTKTIVLTKQFNTFQDINIEIVNPYRMLLYKAKYVLIASLIIVVFIALILLFLLRSALRENRFVRFIKEYTNALTHDLRSPLNSIYMASSSVYKNGESMSIYTVRDYIRMCKEQSKDLLDQIDRILTVAKTEQTELIVDKKTIFLKPFLQEVTGKFVDDKVHAKPISLEVECDENVEVPMDQRLMTRVMNNLLDNAVKYSYETALINVKAWKEGNTVRIRVKDNGMGIPAKDLDAIFEHFNQGSVLERKGQFGYGIGLSFIKQVIQSHGGHMEVVNKEEEGSEFIIVLPA